MSAIDLLPPNASLLERSLAEVSDIYARTDEAISSMRRLKLGNPPPPLLPFLIYEYGLGELSPFVPSLYELLADGVQWQRVRGTPAAVAMALGWLGYAAEIEEAAVRRAYWNLFQLAMARIRDNEDDLIRIEGVTGLSVPLRSVFWRGYHGYDVRAVESDWTRLDGTLLETYSGARVDPGIVKWSYGRRYEIDHEMTEDELTDLGVWIEELEGDDDLTWVDAPWPDEPWVNTDARIRRQLMLASIAPGYAWAVFRDADGEVIGSRRARARRAVAPATGGPYKHGGISYAPVTDGGEIMLVDVLTGFGDGYGATAASVSFVLTATPPPPFRAGALWLPGVHVDAAATEVATTEINIEFGRTVREHVCALLRF